MKLFTFRENQHIVTGVLTGDIYYNVSTLFPLYDAHFFENDGLKLLQEAIDTQNTQLSVIQHPENLVFGAPFATP